MQKYFVLDTNVLLHNADSISSFSDNVVVLPMSVIEELDRFKSHNNELARNARHVIRQLDHLRAKGNLGRGVEMDNGGTLKIYHERDLADHGLDMRIADNRILGVAFTLFKQDKKVIFVSKDINARLKADALGIEVMDFEKQKVNFDELFAGNCQVKVPGAKVDEFYVNKKLTLDGCLVVPNEFVLLIDESDEKHTALARSSNGGVLVPLVPDYNEAFGLKPRNKEQRMALELLLDPEVLLVTMVGQAGTGKTLLALAAALETTINFHRYERILVSRPVIPMGKDLGYMPGDKDEKLFHWMQPIFDNLTFLISAQGRKSGDKHEESVKQKVDKLLRDNVIELEALTYIRGRSIPNQYVIVDEAQNLTPHEVKTIVSRAGEGTKVVLTGDPEQIDNPYLDSSSNGLSYAVERMKGQPLHGHITLRKSERSNLAGAAAEFL
ncbi:MAG: PhoH family protein [Desulfurivibrionaceae bacterium]|nr:PhoH family protein [Desulfobulbales bacterium]MDT8334103.1 PhoH family protein [Desulfurivibrionaceae bacterium]